MGENQGSKLGEELWRRLEISLPWLVARPSEDSVTMRRLRMMAMHLSWKSPAYGPPAVPALKRLLAYVTASLASISLFL